MGKSMNADGNPEIQVVPIWAKEGFGHIKRKQGRFLTVIPTKNVNFIHAVYIQGPLYRMILQPEFR